MLHFFIVCLRWWDAKCVVACGQQGTNTSSKIWCQVPLPTELSSPSTIVFDYSAFIVGFRIGKCDFFSFVFLSVVCLLVWLSMPLWACISVMPFLFSYQTIEILLDSELKLRVLWSSISVLNVLALPNQKEFST